MLVKDIFFSYFCVFFATVTAQLGNKCTVKTSNSAGICKLGSDCPIVEEEASQGIDPTLCGFHELIRPIVCCPTDDFRPQKEDDKNVLVQSLLIPDKDHQRLSEKS